MAGKTGEIINLQIGGCGNSIGQSWLKNMMTEHRIHLDGTYCKQMNDKMDEDHEMEIRLARINSYFDEIEAGTLTNGFVKTESMYLASEIVALCKQYTSSFDTNRYRPRSILIDSDPNIIDQTKVSPYNQLLRLNNFVIGFEAMHNNWCVPN